MKSHLEGGWIGDNANQGQIKKLKQQQSQTRITRWMQASKYDNEYDEQL